jgi:Activator of Hsp90 ATPase homolog 1-like protein
MRFEHMPPHGEGWEFTVIEPPRRLHWKQMLADADGNVSGNARMPDWPRVMLTTIELAPHADGTLQRLTWQPHGATAAGLACFRRAAAQLSQGWAGGFDNLVGVLRDLAAA